MRYAVQVGDQEWVVDEPDPKPGEPIEGSVRVLVNPNRVHVINGG